MFKLEKVFQNDDLFFIRLINLIKSLLIILSSYIFIILNNNSFLGVLVAKSDMAHNRLEYQKNILSLVEKILTQIESELENKK